MSDEEADQIRGRSCQRLSANLRATLLSDGIVKEERDRLVFLADHEFSSPSAAAAVIHGGQANGLTAWKDSKGISLKHKEEKDIQPINSANLK
ncbi:MAG: DUF4357 domain-containing protein [Desulfobacterales bacterium]|nr:DUF4357 domain-containing protein [Desulfobacterales bacterium]